MTFEDYTDDEIQLLSECLNRVVVPSVYAEPEIPIPIEQGLSLISQTNITA
jgi:hypothetical protein